MKCWNGGIGSVLFGALVKVLGLKGFLVLFAFGCLFFCLPAWIRGVLSNHILWFLPFNFQ